jgi:hypothetical protein
LAAGAVKGKIEGGMSIQDVAVRLIHVSNYPQEGIQTMQYMLLIHNERQDLTAAQVAELMPQYMTFTEELVKSGKFKAGDRLESSADARTVRVRNGKTVTIDGPFAETKEQLGGYYIVEAKDLEEATAIAARIPGARIGSIEVRAVASMPSRQG